jgi:hypothetical protein
MQIDISPEALLAKEIQAARALFGLSLEFDKGELITKFNELIRESHPDFTKKKDNFAEKETSGHDKTAEVIVAFKLLKSLAIAESGTAKTARARATLALNELAEICLTCDGFGNVPVTLWSYDPCPSCEGSGLLRQHCTQCDKGKFKLKSGRLVDCLRCSGKGFFFSTTWFSYKNTCRTCWGSGTKLQTAVSETLFQTCLSCKGAGKKELVLFNPVFAGIAVNISGNKLSQRERRRLSSGG